MLHRFFSAWRPVSQGELNAVTGNTKSQYLSLLSDLCPVKRVIHVHRLSSGRSGSALPLPRKRRESVYLAD